MSPSYPVAHGSGPLLSAASAAPAPWSPGTIAGHNSRPPFVILSWLGELHVHRASRSTRTVPRRRACSAPQLRHHPSAPHSAASRTRRERPPVAHRCRHRRTRAEQPPGLRVRLAGVAALGRRARARRTARGFRRRRRLRHTAVAAPATVRAARAAIAKVHRVSRLTDPTADGLCGNMLKRIAPRGA